MPLAPIAYRTVRIPKKSGGYREIDIPDPALKEVQKKILRLLMSMRISPGPHLHAYCRRRGTKTMAEGLQINLGDGKKRAPRYLLKMDIKDFFPSVTDDMVVVAMTREGIPVPVITMVTTHCFVRKGNNSVLPQGAPTSPFLSNLVMKMVARRLYGVVRKRMRKYPFDVKLAIYCDNIMIAGDTKAISGLKHLIRYVISECGFSLNGAKTRLICPRGRKEACGVVISSKTSVRRDAWRLMRAIIHNARTDLRSGRARPNFYLDHVARKKSRVTHADASPIPWSEWKGTISYIGMLNPSRGAQLKAALDELERETKCAGNTSGSKTAGRRTSSKSTTGRCQKAT